MLKVISFDVIPKNSSLFICTIPYDLYLNLTVPFRAITGILCHSVI